MRQQGTVIHIIESFENAQYAIPKGSGDNIPPSNDQFWHKLAKVGNQNYNLTSHDTSQIPAATQSQSRGFTGTTEGSEHSNTDRLHLCTINKTFAFLLIYLNFVVI